MYLNGLRDFYLHQGKSTIALASLVLMDTPSGNYALSPFFELCDALPLFNPVCPAFINIDHKHLKPGMSRHLGNTAAHLPCTNNGNPFNALHLPHPSITALKTSLFSFPKMPSCLPVYLQCHGPQTRTALLRSLMR